MKRRSRPTRRSTASSRTTSNTVCSSPRRRRRPVKATGRARSTLDSLRRLPVPCETIRGSTARKPGRQFALRLQAATDRRGSGSGQEHDSRERDLLVASALLTEGNAWQELGDAPKAIAKPRRRNRSTPCRRSRWRKPSASANVGIASRIPGRPDGCQADVRTGARDRA